MENRENLAVKMIKRMYDISGVLDEYRQSRINEVGNQAFMMFYLYTPLSFLLAMLFIDSHPKEALQVLLISNFLLFIIITIYIFVKTSDLNLQDIEVEPKNYQQTRKHLVRKSLKNTGYSTVLIYLLVPLITLITTGGSYIAMLISWNHVKWSLIAGVLIVSLNIVSTLLRIKKVE